MTIFDASGSNFDTPTPAEEGDFGGRKPRRRLFSGRIARSDWVYTLPAICKLYGVSVNTPGNWVKEGLQTIDGQKPHAVRGSELNRFHGERRKKAKGLPLKSYELFCLSCGPQEPKNGVIRIDSSQRGAACIIADCPDCGNRIERLVGPAGVKLFRERYKIQS